MTLGSLEGPSRLTKGGQIPRLYSHRPALLLKKMRLFLIILAASSVSSAPFLEDEEGSAFASLGTNHRRPQTTSVFGVQRVPPSPFLNKPFSGRGKTDFLKPIFQGTPRVHHMEQGAAQRKMIWQDAIRKKTKSRPDQVLPLREDALKTRCNALPFMQNVFRKDCAPQQIPNNFCFGQCNSFYVPGWPSGLSQPCTSCTPIRSRRVSVPLRCRGGRVWWEEVVLVEECDCETRHDQQLSQVGSGEGFLPVS